MPNPLQSQMVMPTSQAVVSPGTVQATNSQPTPQMQSQMRNFFPPSGPVSSLPGLAGVGNASNPAKYGQPTAPAPLSGQQQLPSNNYAQPPQTFGPTQASPPSYFQSYGGNQQYMPQQQLGFSGFNFVPSAMPPSITQSAAGGGPQSVQNYLTALQQAGAGGNNRMMNQPGQLGAGAQGGFQGFGVNGMANPSFGPIAMGGGYGGGQLGASGNSAFSNPMAYAQNVAQGGMYGQANAPGISQIANPQGYNQVAGNIPQWLNNYQSPQQLAAQQQAQQEQQQIQQQIQNLENNPLQALQNGSMQQLGNTVQQYGQNQQNATYSDENLKTNISNAENELQEFMNALGAYSYEYKNPEHGEKRYVSPMAQELEKSKIGKSAVIETPAGKMVDYARISGVQLAATAMLNNKINKLEKKFSEMIKGKFNGK